MFLASGIAITFTFVEPNKYKNPLTGEESSSEHKFSRFEYVGSDRFNVAYMRHTEKFWEFMQDVTLEQCLETLQTLPHLRPF